MEFFRRWAFLLAAAAALILWGAPSPALAEEPAPGWSPVVTDQGLFGYMETARVPPITGWRLILERTPQREWKITILVAGD